MNNLKFKKDVVSELNLDTIKSINSGGASTMTIGTTSTILIVIAQITMTTITFH